MFKFQQNPMEKTDYIVGSTWSTLNKSWKGYRKAKEGVNILQMKLFARRIITLQKKLGLKDSQFTELKEYLNEELYR